MEEPECNGICLYAADLGLPYSGVAYAHPDCPAHGDPIPDEWEPVSDEDAPFPDPQAS